MKLKIVLCTVLFLGFSNSILSQNVLSVETKEITTATEFELAISLENTDEIAAIQFDISYNVNEFELLTGHSLTSRGLNHTLGINSISQGVVRVVMYSFSSNPNIIGNSGGLLALKLKSKNNSGNFPFTLSNIVSSSSSGGAITSTKNDGVITVLGPKMEVQVGQINFGSVLLGSNQTRSLPIRNSGNQPLEITSVNDVFPFSIQESFPISIQPNSTTYLTVSIDASIKFKGSKEISFVNNDPEINRNSQTVNLSADVYAINTIRIGTGSGEINSEVEIPISIENMEDFTGFQFDILLPEGIEYIANSIIETSRFDGHLIGVNLINGNTLRFIGYSSVNKNFKGNSGELFRFKLKPIVNAGYFSLNVSNAILTNIEQENILSNSYSGYIQINSPNLYINPSNINFGSVPITKTQQTSLRLSNTGSASLLIDEVVYDTSELSLDIQLPLTIPEGSYQDVNLVFTPLSTGEFSETIILNHNGGGNQASVVVQSSVYSPNYLMVENQEGYPNETNVFSILLKNNDEVRAVQFDVELPVGFELDVNTIGITDRTSGFEVAASKLSGTIYRIILYSLSNQVINKGDLSIIKLPVVISKDAVLGAYQFNFANVIISDVKNQNVSSSILENGTITIVEKDTDNDGIYDTVDNCIGTYNPNQEDLDGDGIGDACADDIDGDGVMNNVDVCPNTPSGETVDANGCSSSQLDTDGDGIMDSVDVCPNTPSGETVDTNGCSSSQLDNDKDGVMNNVDVCPNTPSGESADTNGCSSSQLDTDGDGIMDNVDVCPNTPSGETADTNGCSSSQLDTDGDGVMDNVDLCPNTPSGETADANGCSSGQLDDDNDDDGIKNDVDFCHFTPSGETVDANGCSSSQLDTDGDGIKDNIDNCPTISNVNQSDIDGDLIGDLCDDDKDGDGVLNVDDNSPEIANPNQEDMDGDGIGDVSDTDIDGDGVLNEVDNCPITSNPNQSDIDGDLIGDDCDTDMDGDGVLNVDDNSPEIANPNQEDLDGDGIGDVSDTDMDGDGFLNDVDNCPTISNVNQSDIDFDGIGDLCDDDKDGDGVLNVDDNSPEMANPNQEDLDGDGIGDVSDTDMDGDEVLNDVDNCPTISNVNQSDIDGDGVGDHCDDDKDGDGVLNVDDNSPEISNPNQEDLDGDGIGDVSDTDMDGDGFLNDVDTCPTISNVNQSDIDGDDIGDLCDNDKDGDGVLNVNDNSPEIANPNQEDLDGDGIGDVSDTDIDGDGVLNEVDNCPITSNPNQEDIDSDGIGDLCDDDMDGDNVNNTIDLCPNTLSGTNVDATGCPIFSLPSSNFTVTAISETCPGKNNGQILITGQVSHPYVATINGANYNFTNNNLTVDKLQPGDYTVCISVTGQTYKQCYVVTIAPGTTVSAKASVDVGKVSINIDRGTAPFDVFVNDLKVFQTFDATFNVHAKNGDKVEVKTGVTCEGTFSKIIEFFDVATAYPNPTAGLFTIALSNVSDKNVEVELYTLESQLISRKLHPIVNGKIQLNITEKPTGLYIAKINLKEPIVLKIVKQ